MDDDDEKVKITFGNMPAGVSPGAKSQTIVSITDDDVPSVTRKLRASLPTRSPKAAAVTVKLTLSQKPEREVIIPLTKTEQDGASSSDYSTIPSALTFGPQDTEKSFTFSATDDADNDDGESVRISLGALPTGVSEGTNKETVVSISDDDVPTVSVSFENTSYAVDEGQSQAIKVILSATPERPVDIQVNATFLNGVGSTDFLGVPTTLNFGQNDTEKTLTFTAVDDSHDDDGEKVRLGFTNLPSQVNAGTNSQATVSINDNDHPAVTVTFEQDSYTVAEGSAVTVKVKLSADPERTVTVPITKTNQGGASASDYNVPNSVVFNSGDTEKPFTFTAIADADNDDGESVKLGFGSSLPARVTSGTPSETTVSITDDDVPSVTVNFEQAAYTVTEGDSISIKLELSADPERSVTIPLAATNMDGATAADHSGPPGSVTFNSGDTEKTFNFSTTEDRIDDDGERVRLNFGTLPPGVSSTGPSQAVVSIQRRRHRRHHPEHPKPQRGRGRHRILHGGPGFPAHRQCDRYGHRPFRHGPHPVGDQPHFHHKQLGNVPDHHRDGRGGRGRRARHLRNPHPHGCRRRLWVNHQDPPGHHFRK